MTRKDFLKILKNGFYGFAASRLNLHSIYGSLIKETKVKNWVWFNPWRNRSYDDYKRDFEKIKLSGIDAILPNVYSGWKAAFNSMHLPVSGPLLEKLLPIATEMDLEVHAWMWTMICNNESILEKNPNWFVVNRNGESAIDSPAYVNYYRFMCPNNGEVQKFISKTVAELSSYSELKGIHLDYVRFPDVILAEKLQDKYGIVQDKEYPEYDYCYCEQCCSDFKELTGVDIKKSSHPEDDKIWREFRYKSITKMVNNFLVPAAKKNNKMITAAVFPNWKNVRQEWSKWKLDAVFPMLYHDYYNKDIDWIVNQIINGKNSLKSSVKLYCGLMVDMFEVEELKHAIDRALAAKANGVSFFGYHSLKEDHWKMLSKMDLNDGN